MVQTRRQEKTTPDRDDTDRAPDDESVLTPRGRRRQTRDKLRAKSTGLGLSIAIDGNNRNSNKKVLFNGEDTKKLETGEDESKVQEEKEREAKEDGKSDVEYTGDNDDDEVEEIKGSDAKSQMNKAVTIEKSTAKESLQGRKRKRNSRKTADTDAGNELDEDFFEQLDAEKKGDRELRKARKQMGKDFQGKLTTFVARDDSVEGLEPNMKDQNIQVVVLNTSPNSNGPPLPPRSSNYFTASSSYSKTNVLEGKDLISEKQRHKAKKSGRDVDAVVSTWKRSSKLNRILLSGSKIKTRNVSSKKPKGMVVQL